MENLKDLSQADIDFATTGKDQHQRNDTNGNIIPLREFEVEEIGFWVNGDYIYDYQLNMPEMINQENNNSDLRISSSIFYNFFD